MIGAYYDGTRPKAADSVIAGRHLAFRQECAPLPFRIPQEWMDTVFYLYKDEAAASASEISGGTGFLLGWPIPETTDFTLWAVTSWHVVQNGNWTIRLNRRDGGFAALDTTDLEWVRHPESDLAVRPIALSRDDLRFNFLTPEWLLGKDWYHALDIGPGDETCTIGRFVGHGGKKQNYPSARFGQISQCPNETVIIGDLEQECFLVESRSIGGYSGSPVYVYLDNNYYRKTINARIAPDGRTLGQGAFPTGPWLLGLSFAMVPIWEPVCDKTGKVVNVDYRVPINTGLMGVIPAWHLSELMMSDPVSQIRGQVQSILAKSAVNLPPAIQTSASPAAALSPHPPRD